MKERILRVKTQDIYRFVQAALLTGIVLAGIGRSIGIKDIHTVHFLIAFAALAAIFGMQRMTKKGRAAAILCLIFILSIVPGIRNCALFIRSYAGWLTDADTWEDVWVLGYETMQIIAVSACCYILQCILEKYFLLKTAVLCLLVCALVVCLLAKKTVSHDGVAFILSYMMAAGGEWIERSWKKEKKKDQRAYMFWLMPFMALYLLVMLWLPAPENPFKWQFARNAFQQVKESVIVLTQNIMRGGTENFDTVLSGFSENGMIGGNLEEDHRPVMVIQGDGNLVGNVYLAGKTYDVFDGRQWVRRDESTAYETFLDTIQTRYAAEQFEGRYLHDCMSLTTLHVRYEYFNSAYVFVPLKTQRIMEDNKDLAFIPAKGSLFFADADHQNADKRGYGTEYDVAFYQLNAGSEAFEDFLISRQHESVQADAVMKRILKARTKRTGIDITEEDISAYIRQVGDVYAEDVVLSRAARAYVDEITASAHNDIEKLRMIEAELTAYTYTKSPGKLPDTVKDAGSFLDYVLLESREGYCTHFATAFALLARAEGLPSRYVQGFCVPAGQGEETVVYNDMAHSWPEVYIDGIGWIPFEPTPGYSSLRNTSWETGWKYEPSYAVPEDHAAYGVTDGSALSSGAVEGNMAGRESSVRDGLDKAVNAAPVFAAAGLLFAVFELVIRKRRYQKMNLTEKFNKKVRDNLRILSWLGLRRGEAETLQEFGRRAAQELGLAKKQPAFLEMYEALIYGEKSVDEAALKEAGAEEKQLLAILQEKKKRTYFYYCVRVYFD